MSGIDKLFQDKIGKHESAYSSDVWDNIASALDKTEKKRRGLTWLWFGGFLIIGGLVSYVLLTSVKTSDKIPAVSSMTSTTASISTSDILAKKENVIVDQNTIEEKSDQVEAPLSIIEKTTRPVIVDQSNTETDFQSSSSYADRVAFRTTQETEILVPNSEFSKNKLSPRQDIDPLSSLGLTESTLTYNMHLMPDRRFGRQVPTDCPEFTVNRPGLYVDLYYAHEIGLRSLKAKVPEFEEYVGLRNESESARYSFSAGVRLHYVLNKGFNIKSGLNYSQINEVFEYEDPESIRFVTTITTDSIYDPVKMIWLVDSDTIRTQVNGTKVTRIQNRFRQLDIPVILGYESKINDKFSYSINVGVYLNILFAQRGQFLDPVDHLPVWYGGINSGNYEAYKSNVDVSFYTGAAFIYHWADGIDFYAEPSFRFYPQSFSLGQYPLEQNYSVVGLHTGIRYRF